MKPAPTAAMLFPSPPRMATVNPLMASPAPILYCVYVIGDTTQPARAPMPADRMKDKVSRAEAVSQAWAEVASGDLEDRFAALEKEKEIDRLLADLKSRKLLGA